MAATDTELVTRIQAGDMEAFGQLVDRHKDPLVNYVTRLTRCRERAEEIAQETFLRFYQARGHYTERQMLAAYLFRIATNLLRSEERRARRWRLLSMGLTASPNGHDQDPTPQQALLSDEASGEVTAALSRLALRYRAPLVLREIEGLSYREIAEALGCREGTVKSRISRGKAQLKRLLEPYWNGESGS